jgi:hypothetical protein
MGPVDKKRISDDQKKMIASAMEQHGSCIWKLDHPFHKKPDAIASAYRKIAEQVGLDGNKLIFTFPIKFN